MAVQQSLIDALNRILGRHRCTCSDPRWLVGALILWCYSNISELFIKNMNFCLFNHADYLIQRYISFPVFLQIHCHDSFDNSKLKCISRPNLNQKSWSELMQRFYKFKNPYSISLILASRPHLKQTHGLNYSIVNMQVKQWSEECFRKFMIVNVLKILVEWSIINISIHDRLILSFRGVQKRSTEILERNQFSWWCFSDKFFLFSANFCPIFDF